MNTVTQNGNRANVTLYPNKVYHKVKRLHPIALFLTLQMSSLLAGSEANGSLVTGISSLKFA